MSYDDIRIILDSENSAIIANNLDELTRLLEICEELGFKWYDRSPPLKY